jgi:hypothetical protein
MYQCDVCSNVRRVVCSTTPATAKTDAAIAPRLNISLKNILQCECNNSVTAVLRPCTQSVTTVQQQRNNSVTKV